MELAKGVGVAIAARSWHCYKKELEILEQSSVALPAIIAEQRHRKLQRCELVAPPQAPAPSQVATLKL